MEIKIYKIENKNGMFSGGGTYPRWTKKGKTWSDIGAVKRHLVQFCSSYEWENNKTVYSWKNNIPEDWTVLEITNNGVERYSAKELYPLTEIKSEINS